MDSSFPVWIYMAQWITEKYKIKNINTCKKELVIQGKTQKQTSSDNMIILDHMMLKPI